MNDSNPSADQLKVRQQKEALALQEYLATLDPLSPLRRTLGHMTGHALELASQIFHAIQQELPERSDWLAAFQQYQPQITLLVQLQRQAERNQQLAAKLAADEGGDEGGDEPRGEVSTS